MKCKLCLKEYKKLCKAHIIPEFMYKDLYDEKGFLYIIEFKENKIKTKKIPKGKYDKEILCLDCDNYINEISENYVSKIYNVLLKGGEHDRGVKDGQIPIRKFIPQIPQHLAEYHFDNLDYKQFKLFYLSILWRASISSLEEFEEVELGKYEQILRDMIRSENPGDVEDYPVLIFNCREDVSILEEMIHPPMKFKDKEGTIYLFQINGLVYTFYISKHRTPGYALNKTINKDNHLEIPIAPRGQGKILYRKIFDIFA